MILSHNATSVHAKGAGVLRLGTRGSTLALWQANHVKDALEAMGYQVTLERMTTQGDQILDRPLAQIEGKSLFTRELDLAILDGRIDLAVHSLKDLPSKLPDGLTFGAISKRETPYDAFIAHPDYKGTLDDLPQGAIIATSSLRRTAQLKAWRPDLDIVPVRGNVDSRLAKLDASSWYGMVLASAGLIRLGLARRIHTAFELDRMVPAAGQGALGIVCAAAHPEIQVLLKKALHNAETAVCVRSERAFLAMLDGSCQVPVGALAFRRDDGLIALHGLVASLDGNVVLKGHEMVSVDVPEDAGRRLAKRLLDQGAAKILQLLGSN